MAFCKWLVKYNNLIKDYNSTVLEKNNVLSDDIINIFYKELTISDI